MNWSIKSTASRKPGNLRLFLSCDSRIFIFEPAHETMALFVFRKLVLQTLMRSHPVGLDVWFLVGPFIYFHTSRVRTTKALVRLRGCAGSPEPSLAGRLCDKYHNLMGWLIYGLLPTTFILVYKLLLNWPFGISKACCLSPKPLRPQYVNNCTFSYKNV